MRTCWYTLIWVILWILRVPCSRGDVAKRRYVISSPSFSWDSRSNLPDEVFDLVLRDAKDAFDRERDRKKTLDAKVRMLLLLSALMLSFSTLFSEYAPFYLSIIPAFFLVVTTLLLTNYLGVSTISEPSPIEPIDGNSQPVGVLKRNLAKDYRKATAYNEGVINYHADVFRAALRSFIIGLLAIIITGATATIIQSPEDAIKDRVIETLRSDAKLRDSLKGPVRPQGPSGPAGPAGPTGPPGPPSTNGP